MKLALGFGAIVFSMALVGAPQAQAQAAGTAGGAGGNTVGDVLFDDYENQGSVKIPPSEIAELVSPYLKPIERKVPHFADALREGIKGMTWFREPKPLDQNGKCRDGESDGLEGRVDQVVRACQNNLDVRIEKAFYDARKVAALEAVRRHLSPTLLSDLLMHELIMYQRVHGDGISEEAVFMISRAVRNREPEGVLTAEQLVAKLQVAGFGDYATKAQLDAIDEVVEDAAARNDACYCPTAESRLMQIIMNNADNTDISHAAAEANEKVWDLGQRLPYCSAKDKF